MEYIEGWGDDKSSSWTWFEMVIVTESRPLARNAGHIWPLARKLQINHNEAANPDYQEISTTISRLSDRETYRGWLSSIRPGEKIQVLPQARFLRWVNNIREIELEVSWSLNVQTSLAPDPALPAPDSRSSIPMYLPLRVDRPEIRLLEIQSGHSNEHVVCSMLHTSIKDTKNQIPYTALSYCWGSPKTKKAITVQVPLEFDDPGTQTQVFEVQIQENLYDAIKHLRRQDGRSRTLWADFLCIDQDNIEERNRQVSLMRDIYANADHVYIWLGHESETTVDMLNVKDTFVQAFEQGHERFLSSSCNDLTKVHGTSDTRNIIFFQMSLLFLFDWFTRVWVIQEVFNAGEATVQIGSVSLPWPLVVRIGNCLQRAHRRARTLGLINMPLIFSSIFDVALDSNKIFSTKRHTDDLLGVIVASLDLDATDPRDKIFALIQFWKDVNLQALPDEVRPDYQKSVRQVFADFTRWWIKTHQSLRILSGIHLVLGRTWQRMSVEPNPDLPNDRPSWSLWHNGSSSWTAGTLGYSKDCPYMASGSIVTERRLLESSYEPDILNLEGVRIGSIHNISLFPWLGTKTPDVEDLSQVFEEVFDPRRVSGTWTPGGNDSSTDDPNYDVQQEDHMVSHYDFMRRNNGALPCISHCLFTSRTPYGQAFVGLCPYTARPGDIITVLTGGNVPYLLRRIPRNHSGRAQEDRYGLVGECYARGYMDGRAIVDWKEGRLTLENFALV
jgi:hypothetical protein